MCDKQNLNILDELSVLNTLSTLNTLDNGNLDPLLLLLSSETNISLNRVFYTKINSEQINHCEKFLLNSFSKDFWISRIDFNKLIYFISLSESCEKWYKDIFKEMIDYFKWKFSISEIQDIILSITNQPDDIRDFWKKLYYSLDFVSKNLWPDVEKKEKKDFYSEFEDFLKEWRIIKILSSGEENICVNEQNVRLSFSFDSVENKYKFKIWDLIKDTVLNLEIDNKNMRSVFTFNNIEEVFNFIEKNFSDLKLPENIDNYVIK